MIPAPGQMVTWVQRIGRGANERLVRRPAIVITELYPMDALSLAVFLRPSDLPEPYRMREPIPASVCCEPVFPGGHPSAEDTWWEPVEGPAE